MSLFPRRPVPESDSPTESETEPAVASATKGRPTPKRRDSTVRRGPVSAPKTRKEAAARQRQQAKSARASRGTASSGMTAEQRRAALRAGDPSVLPRRDQGPTRKLARDYVDSHRMASNYLLLLFPLMILAYTVPGLSYAVPVLLIVLIIEWYLVGSRIRRLATERLGKADGSAMSIGWYAGSRAYLPRRWRLPAPQVQLHDTI